MENKSKNQVEYVINKQGGPILNNSFLIASGENIAAIEIDMHSKRCQILHEIITEDGTPIICLSGQQDSHFLKENLEHEYTQVSFPNYRGWKIFLADITRYTLRICFIR